MKNKNENINFMQEKENSLLERLGMSITLAGLVFVFSGCGRVYFPAGIYPSLAPIQKEGAESQRKTMFYDKSVSESLPLLVYGF